MCVHGLTCWVHASEKDTQVKKKGAREGGRGREREEEEGEKKKQLCVMESPSCAV